MDEHQWRDWQVFIFIFLASSLAGLTRLLQSNKVLGARVIAGTMLGAAFYSTCAAGVVWNYVGRENIYALVGMSVLAGLGSQQAVSFTWTLMTLAVEKFGKK